MAMNATLETRRSKHWCFTCNNPTVPELTFSSETVAYAVYQLETGESGTPHFQGYIQLTGKLGKRIPAVRKILAKAGYPNPHLEARRGTTEQCITYCSKDEGRVAGPFFFGTPFFSQQGSRTDLHALRDAVKEKRKFSDIADDDSLLPVLAKHYRFEGRLRENYSMADSKDFRKLKVTVLWGSTGSGKTRFAVEQGAYKWHPSSPEWWDGYQGESSMLIDEFYGQLKPSRLLQLLDGYSCRLPVKGGHTYAAWTDVYITSNEPPENWYTDLPQKVKEALERRITRVVEMGETHQKPPFDFARNRDYNGCPPS